MYDDKFFKHTGETRKRDSSFNECVKKKPMLLKDIYRFIRKN